MTMRPAQNRRWVMAERPVDRAVRESDFRFETAPVSELAEGQFLVQTMFLSLAPVMRAYMIDGAGIEKPLQSGETMRGRGVGRIVASRNAQWVVGEIVHGKLGWQEYAVCDGSPYFLMYKVLQRVAPFSTALGALGLTGFTSYLGLVDIGAVREGDVVLVSGAAGGVGSLCGQIVRNLGARAVGIAGSDPKCRMLTAELGYDSAINYRSESVGERIGQLCPQGIDVFFDNVGGEILDAGLAHIRRHARIVLCGQISTYLDGQQRPVPLHNHTAIFKKMARMEAFFIYEMAGHFARAEGQMASWIASGRLHYREDVLDGIEQMPRALIRLYEGRNLGKQLVRVAE